MKLSPVTLRFLRSEFYLNCFRKEVGNPTKLLQIWDLTTLPIPWQNTGKILLSPKYVEVM